MDDDIQNYLPTVMFGETPAVSSLEIASTN